MTALPFIPGQTYKRSEIHDRWGGNRQSGICPSTSYPYIFIFSGKTGKQYGYEDGWDNENVFLYTGEGQVGVSQVPEVFQVKLVGIPRFKCVVQFT